MPDKWDQYAVPAQQPAADKWAQYEAAPAAAAPPETKDGIAGYGQGLVTGLKNLVHSVAHPIDTITAQGSQVLAGGVTPYGTPLLPLTGNQKVDAQNQELQQGARDQMAEQGKEMAAHPANTAGQFTVPALLAGASFGAPKLAPLFKGSGAALDNLVLGTKMSDINRGANPGAALSANRIVGGSPASLLRGINEAIPKVGAENKAILSTADPLNKINTGPPLSNPFNSGLAEATDPITGVSTPGQVGKASRTATGLRNILDPQTGRPTPMMRDPFMSPLDASKLKTNLYNQIDYDTPSKSALSNTSLKGAAHNLKSAIEEAVPESRESGQRLHNLMSAKDLLEPSARGARLIPVDKSGIIQRGINYGATGSAAGLDAAGGALDAVGRYINTPALAPVLTDLPFAASSKKQK